MPNMLDYLAWRGDLTLAQSPLNENDELVLSQLGYVAFEDHLPGLEGGPEQGIALHDAVSWLLQHDPEGEKIHQTGYMWKDNQKLLRALHCSERFGDMRMWGSVDVISPEDEKQFAAVTFTVGDGSTHIVFRGTDDTLVGWKEDLNMALLSTIPAQREAHHYLEQVAAVTSGPLRLSGHSKGGNLAIYAAACCEEAVAERITDVVSHDGPGYSSDLIQTDGYARVRPRVRVYIPHFSFVGMLLEHENNYIVVQSDARTILQHNAFSWQMEGTRMLYADAPSEDSLHTNRIVRDWIHTLDPDAQHLFVEAVYEVACATYGDTLPEDVERNWPQTTQAVFSAVLKLEPKLRGSFTKSLGELFSSALRNFRFPWQREEKETRHGLSVAVDASNENE